MPAHALLTDFYELTMLQAYHAQRMNGIAVFELFVRKLPPGRNFLLAAGLAELGVFEPNVPQTNIVVANVRRGSLEQWVGAFREQGVLAVPFGRGRMRMVTHLNITREDIEEALRRVRRAVEAVAV